MSVSLHVTMVNKKKEDFVMLILEVHTHNAVVIIFLR